MEHDSDYNWIGFPRYSREYKEGIKGFVEKAFPLFAVGDEMKCPCRDCDDRKWHRQDVIYGHLICRGPSPSQVQWICKVSDVKVRNSADFKECEAGTVFGDNLQQMFDCTGRKFQNVEHGPNAEAKKFYHLVEEGKQPLYPGCKKYSRLSFMIKLYHLKCVHGITESGFEDLLVLIKDTFPEANVPLTFTAAKNIIKDLGLDYQRIHACPNSCMLYWGENKDKQVCANCGVSRWVLQEKKGSAASNDPEKLISKVPANVMRYFPLKPRLQRLFMCKEFSKLMTWHATGRIEDGKLRHPGDAKAWKTMDANYPDFASEIRNIRLGVAADGFSPFRTMNQSHSTWPIVLVNYNLPPWICMKQENLILSTLISGPNSPSNSIDVYMQPLIAELKELWSTGIQTYDAMTDQNFILRAAVLWTISDFPGYAMMSGWSTKGKLACPVCHYETCSQYLKYSRKMCYMNHRRFLHPSHKYRSDKKRFNGEIETRQSAEPLTGTEVEQLLVGFKNQFGEINKKKRKRENDIPFKKKSIFFDLPYWKHNPLRHNLDVMHIEKNICDKILGTLLNMGGKSKDHLNARFDLQEMGIRKSLHPVETVDKQKYEISAAIFDMTKKEKDIFCKVLKNAKMPYGCASNISRYVHTDDRTVLGYKSHDAHFILHYLLQFAVKKSLKAEVVKPLMKFSAFLRGLWSKVIHVDDIKRLQEEIVDILCEFEIIFPPAFFDIMVHLPVHLCREIEYGGPEHIRCMYPIERYLCKLKNYVRNRSKPEGSIAEGYLAEECVTFCSRFLGGELTDFGRCPANVEYHIGTRRNKDGKVIQLKDSVWKACHTYILFNCGNKEIETLIEDHRALVDADANSKRYKREQTHSEDFWKWLKKVVEKRVNISTDLHVLALGPNRTARRFSGYVVNGYRFHTKSRDSRCTTQNSGVFLTAETTSFASSKDENPIVGAVNYYGSVEEIIKVDYWGVFAVVLFKCQWYQEEKDSFGLTKVNFNKLRSKSDPYVIASQVHQIFYVEDPTERNVHYVIKKLPREWCDAEQQNVDEEHNDDNHPDIHDNDLEREFHQEVGDFGWSRDDIPKTEFPKPTEEEEPHV